MMPSQEQLRRHFRYDATSGRLFWRPRTPDEFEDGPRYSAERICAMWNARFAGKEALACVDDKGYKRGTYAGQLFRAHRIVWAYHYGTWPPLLDHKSGNRLNNRIGNLRAATHLSNSRNQRGHRNNMSGATGVYRCGKKWKAQIGGNGIEGGRYLGRFSRKADAVAAVRAERKLRGFSPNHGRL